MRVQSVLIRFTNDDDFFNGMGSKLDNYYIKTNFLAWVLRAVVGCWLVFDRDCLGFFIR